jgi:hypothetical protein
MRQQLLSSTVSCRTTPAELFPPFTLFIVLLVPPVLILYENNALAVPRTVSSPFLGLTIKTHLILGLQTEIQHNQRNRSRKVQQTPRRHFPENETCARPPPAYCLNIAFTRLHISAQPLNLHSCSVNNDSSTTRASRKEAETGHKLTSKASPTLKQSLRSFRRCISNLQKPSHPQPA